jgi:hypothetical protein
MWLRSTITLPFSFSRSKPDKFLASRDCEQGIDWKVNLGVLVLLLVLVISIAAVLAFLILPLALQGAASRRFRCFILLLWVWDTFLVEIAFIQRFVLFLGHPTYALDRSHLSADAVERRRQPVLAPLASANRNGLDADCAGRRRTAR